MKKTIIITSIFIIVLVLIVLSFRNYTKLDVNTTNNNLNLYYTGDNYKIYTYNIDNIKFRNTNLIDYLDSNSIDNIFLFRHKPLELDDGTKIYQINNISIVKCNRLLNDNTYNNDIYFLDDYTSYKNYYCSNDPYTFIRTYKLIKISNGESYGSYYLTIESDNKQYKVYYADINNLLTDNNLELNKYYQFEFHLLDNQNIKEDSVEEIFDNSDVISINLTDNIINEDIK